MGYRNEEGIRVLNVEYGGIHKKQNQIKLVLAGVHLFG